MLILLGLSVLVPHRHKVALRIRDQRLENDHALPQLRGYALQQPIQVPALGGLPLCAKMSETSSYRNLVT